MFTKSVGANATPIAFAEVYLALQQRTVDGQENPLPTIMAKKFYEVQIHVMLTGHITESLLTIVGTHVWAKLTDAEKKVFDEVLTQAAAKATDADPRRRSRRSPTNCASSARPSSRWTARRSARRRCRCTTTQAPAPAGARPNTTRCRR